MTKYKVYPCERLNTLKGVIISRKLSLTTSEEITAAFEKQELTNYKRITIRKGGVEPQTSTYILIFKQPKIPKEVKIEYLLKKVEQYIPAPLRCFNLKGMATTGRVEEDIRHVKSVVKKT